jgi:hypothetical protein
MAEAAQPVLASPLIHTAGRRLCRCGIVHRPAIDRRLAHLLRPYDALFLSATAKNLMLDAMDESVATGMKYGSLHTAYSTTGTNELTGGSPAYARKALTWNAAASGAKAIAATLPTWDVPASTTVAWWGMWDAVTAGNFLGMVPAGAGLPQPCAVEVAADITSDTIFAKAHGLVTDSRCVFWGTLPTGLAVGTIYWVISTGLTADAFKISATQGGAAIDITGTAPFSFFVQKCVPETFGAQGTYALASGSIDLAAIV